MNVRKPVRTAWNVLVRKAPIEAQLIITRRCNLSCGYCNEYDDHSPSIPVDALKERIDALHGLKTAAINLLGGEPLLHPELPALVRYTRRKSLVALITNGFLLSEQIVDDLNDAGLDHMQISVDALAPSNDLFIQKSLKSVRARLRALKDRARFSLHVNAVLCPQSIDEYDELVAEVRALEMPISIGLVHDAEGQVDIEGEPYLSTWEQFYAEEGNFSAIEREYGSRLLQGEKPDWHCRAGHRYIYVDEFGKVQYCASQRGYLGRDVTGYTRANMLAAGSLKKTCSTGCSIGCAYRCSAVDGNLKAVASAWLRGEREHRRRQKAVVARSQPLQA